MAAAHYKTVSIFNMETNEVLCTLKAHSDDVNIINNSLSAVAWSPCGQWLASGGDDKMVHIYDTKTFEVKWPLNVDGEVSSVDWSPCGNKLSAACNNYSGSGSYSVKIFSKEGSTGNLVCQSTLTGHTR